jgi:hypothetical protein
MFNFDDLFSIVIISVYQRSLAVQWFDFVLPRTFLASRGARRGKVMVKCWA